MKTDIRLSNYPASDLRATPAELRAASESAAGEMTKSMCLFGIKSVTARPVQVGTKSILEIDMIPLAATAPGAYATAQKFVVRWIAEYMQLFGISYLEIQPDEAELITIKTTWAAIMQRAEAIQRESAAKAPPTQDPTKTPVTVPPKPG